MVIQRMYYGDNGTVLVFCIYADTIGVNNMDLLAINNEMDYKIGLANSNFRCFVLM